MEQKSNKFISVTYQLYTVDNNETDLVEEATVERPYEFISGFGITLDDFEKAVVDLQKGDSFELTLSQDQAYGPYLDENVLDLDKEVFYIDGKFDDKNIVVDAIIPLLNEDGNRFMGHILEVTKDHVKVDLNHPLAGRDLKFQGNVIESREATNEEIAAMVNSIAGGGCSCGGSCSDGCNCESDGNECGGNCQCS